MNVDGVNPKLHSIINIYWNSDDVILLCTVAPEFWFQTNHHPLILCGVLRYPQTQNACNNKPKQNMFRLKPLGAFTFLCMSVWLEMEDSFFFLLFFAFFCQKLAILDYCFLCSIYNGQNQPRETNIIYIDVITFTHII